MSKSDGKSRTKSVAATAQSMNQKAVSLMDTRRYNQVGHQLPSALPSTGKTSQFIPQGLVSQTDLLQGPWIATTPEEMKEDEWFEDYMRAPGGLGSKKLPFNRYNRYIQRKRSKQQYLDLLRLGGAMIDPKNPETQVDAFAVLPELEEVSNAQYQRDLQQQVTLHHLLMNGHISTKEELLFVDEILAPDYELPKNPIWDPTGAIIQDIANADKRRMAPTSDYNLFQYFIWTPRQHILDDFPARHGAEVEAVNNALAINWVTCTDAEAIAQKMFGMVSSQCLAKARIIQRLFPQFRHVNLGTLTTGGNFGESTDTVVHFVRQYGARLMNLNVNVNGENRRERQITTMVNGLVGTDGQTPALRLDN